MNRTSYNDSTIVVVVGASKFAVTIVIVIGWWLVLYGHRRGFVAAWFIMRAIKFIKGKQTARPKPASAQSKYSLQYQQL